MKNETTDFLRNGSVRSFRGWRPESARYRRLRLQVSRKRLRRSRWRHKSGLLGQDLQRTQTLLQTTCSGTYQLQRSIIVNYHEHRVENLGGEFISLGFKRGRVPLLLGSNAFLLKVFWKFSGWSCFNPPSLISSYVSYVYLWSRIRLVNCSSFIFN